MDVSVIIVNHNTQHYLQECLASVYQHTKDIAFEVVVIDNASADGSREMVRNDFPEVVLVESSDNLGFGRANNKAAEKAGGKYLFFLNPDTVLLNNAVKMFHDFYRQEGSGDIGAMGGILLDENLLPAHSYGKFPSRPGIRKGKLQYLAFRLLGARLYPKTVATVGSSENLPMEVDYVTGAGLFMPAAVFNRLGGFDPRYFLYFEETDLQKRMQGSGLKRMIIPGPEIVHKSSGSFEKTGRQEQLRHYFESLAQYGCKHFSRGNCDGKI